MRSWVGAHAYTDTLDMVTPRDLAAARYAQNHEYMEKILGPQRLGTCPYLPDMMTPPPAAYAHTKPAELKQQLAHVDDEINAMHAAHAQRMAQRTPTPPPEDLAPWEQPMEDARVLGIGNIRASPPASSVAPPRAPTPPVEPATADAITAVNAAHTAAPQSVEEES